MYLPKSHPINSFAEYFEHKFRKSSMIPRKGYYQQQRACGHCIGCFLDHANEWATRIYCECQTNPVGMFLTLTYRPDDLPINDKGYPTLVKEHTQRFWHDLRQKHPECKIKYLIAGEYGEKKGRPHYHACVWGYEPKDLKFYKPSKADPNCKLYKSKEIYDIWGKGMVIIGKLEYRSACYVARYVHKKAKSKANDWKKQHYIDLPVKDSYKFRKDINKQHVTVEESLKYLEKYTYLYDYLEHDIDINTAITTALHSTFKFTRQREKEDCNQLPEFILSSNRPAIGLKYWQQYKDKIKRNSGIFVQYDKKVKLKPIPRYFKKQWEAENWEEYHRWKFQRQKANEINMKSLLANLNIDSEFDDVRRVILLRLSKQNLEAKIPALQRNNFV